MVGAGAAFRRSLCWELLTQPPGPAPAWRAAWPFCVGVPTITVIVSSRESSYGAFGINYDMVFVFKFRRIASWLENVSFVVSISCN